MIIYWVQLETWNQSTTHHILKEDMSEACEAAKTLVELSREPIKDIKIHYVGEVKTI